MALSEDLLAVARRLVDRPGEVRLSVDGPEAEAALLLEVAPEERGKLIGREGRVIKALRTLLAARDARLGQRHDLDVGDD